MPASRLEKVCTHLVAHAIEEDQHRVDKKDEIVARAWAFLVKVGEHVDGDVSPEEETAQVQHEEDSTNHRQNTLPVLLFWLYGKRIVRKIASVF